MQYNELGRTGIKVSRICLGTMTWGEQNTQAQAHEQLDYALSQGVNFIDTAEMYPVPPNQETYTTTEQYIGAWIQARGRRDDIVLASKIAGPTGNNNLEFRPAHSGRSRLSGFAGGRSRAPNGRKGA